MNEKVFCIKCTITNFGARSKYVEAFKTRGNYDLIGSHDFEDTITVISGRVEISDDIILTSSRLKSHLKQFFEEMLNNDQFERILPGHLSEGPASVTMQRVQTVKSRIKKIIGSVQGSQMKLAWLTDIHLRGMVLKGNSE